jgi:hypothetical protein
MSPKEQKRRTYTAAQYHKVLEGYLGGEEDMNRVAEEAGSFCGASLYGSTALKGS